ncbi:MAG: hypothetical protein SWH61_07660 [Thermodesulfobacteriota bacterium]|nr:hypothetical protein [Thermodesulfobacteriota bacterium]
MKIGLHILSISAITFLIVYLLSGQVAFSNQKQDQEIAEYKKAWKFIESDQTEKASDLIKRNYETDVAEDNAFSLFWLVPQGVIEMCEEDYEKALCTINKARPKLKRLYYALKTEPEEQPNDDPLAKKGKEFIAFNYEKILIVSSTANFKLGHWMEALNDYMEGKKEFNHNDYYLKAVCFYRINNYPEALINFQYSYKVNQSKQLKDEIAYNISCLYSILGGVDESILWLKIPLSHDINKWFPKIAGEKDFDNIRNNPKFKNFFEQEKKKFKKRNNM